MITFEKYVENDKKALLEVIKSISDEVSAQDKTLADQKNWDWRYEELPIGKSHVYLAKDNNSIIGYYHIPTYKVFVKNKPMTIGNIQSVAVSKSHRNQNVFQDLAKYANNDIDQHVDLIYTFPNHRSIHTFIKYNDFHTVTVLPLHLRLISVKAFFVKKLNSKLLGSIFGCLFEIYSRSKQKKLDKSDLIEELDIFDRETEALFLKFGLRHEIRLLRNKPYLEWRFNNSLNDKYKIVGLRSNSELVAVAVVKMEYIFSEQCLLIMDLAYDQVDSAKKLLSNIDSLYIEEKIAFIVKSSISVDKKIEKSVGFIKVPSKFNPRKLCLLARWTNANASSDFLKTAKWQVTFSDWDVF
ncbi:GNAT family N-acetyltransferase [Amylibacter sp.]|nr:GNAT family N-acetyltransferase [Amylibacter sp.]MDC1414106.1 GNAT family N-acetyltransferase [Amylibacter sp.]